MNRLTRNESDKMLAGVLSGIAKWLGWDVTPLRIIYAVGSIFSAAFPGIIVYIILWVLMPEDEEVQFPKEN